MNRVGRARTGLVPASACILTGSLLLAGCGQVAGVQAQAVATVAARADCLAPEVLADLGLNLDPSLAAGTSHSPAAEPGSVPDDFAPTGVLECQVGGQMRDGAGTWTAVTATSREGSPDDLAALVAALAESAASPAPCADDAAPLAVWLVDAIERAVRPGVPEGACGTPATVRAALDRLTVTGVVDHPVELIAATPEPTP